MSSFLRVICFVSLIWCSLGHTLTIECMPVHGVNQYAGQTLVNYTGLTAIPLFHAPHPYEVGAHNPGGKTSDLITPNTPLSKLVSTTQSSAKYFGFSIPTMWNNLPLSQIGVLVFGSKNARDRAPVTHFENGAMTSLYRNKFALKNPTLADWAKMTGRVSYNCFTDHKTNQRMAEMALEMCGGMPGSVYTVHAGGCRLCNSGKDQFFANIPGGFPNVLVTDENGLAHRSWTQFGCPGDWEQGGTAFTHISVVYHPDHAAYAASFALASFSPSAPFGYISNIHLFCPMMGEVIFNSADKTYETCAGSGGYDSHDDKILANRLSQSHDAATALGFGMAFGFGGSFVMGALVWYCMLSRPKEGYTLIQMDGR